MAAASGFSGQVTARGTVPIQPVAGATVVLSRAHHENKPVMVTTADANGNYSFNGLMSDDYVIQFSKTGFIQGTMTGSLTGSGNVTINASLVPRLTGLEVEQKDEKTEHLWTIHNPNPFPVSYEWVLPNKKISGLGVAFPGDTSLDTILLPHAEHIHLFVAGVEVQPQAKTTVVPPVTTGTIQGLVTDTLSNPLPAVQISLRDSLNNLLLLQPSYGNGGFTFGGVSPGTYLLDFNLAGYQPESISGIVVTAANVTPVSAVLTPLTPPQLASVAVLVTQSDTNNPITGAAVHIAYASGPNPPDQVTDGNGTAQFADQPVGVAAVITVTANDGSGRSNFQNTSGFTAGSNGLTIQLPPIPPGTLTGTVTDTSNNPVGGVLVSVLGPTNNVIASSTSLADGTYSVGNVSAGTYTTTFSKVGYTTDTFSGIAILSGAATTQNAVLTGFADVSITVTENSPNSPPIANATVVITYSSGVNPPAQTTDGNGLAHFTNQPAGVSCTISVMTNDGSNRSASQGEGGFAPGPNSVLIGIAPIPRGSISGIVSDNNSPAARLAQVQVSIVDSVGNTVATASTLSDGSYAINAIVAGSYNVTFTLHNYGSVTVPVTITNGGNTQLNATLVPNPGTIPASLTITVLDGGGTPPGPLAKSTVTLSYAGAPSPAPSGITDGTGTIFFDSSTAPGLVNSLQVTFTVAVNDAFGRTTSQTLTLSPNGGNNPVTVVINAAPTGNLSGNVTGAGPLSGVLVAVVDANNNTVGTATTDASGDYSINNLETATYTVNFTPASGYQNLSVPNVVITAGNTTTQNATLTPVANPMNANVTVTVVDSNGAAIQLSDMAVIINFSDGSQQSVLTDVNGIASFQNLLVGVGGTVQAETFETPDRTGTVPIPSGGFTSGSNSVTVTVN